MKNIFLGLFYLNLATLSVFANCISMDGNNDPQNSTTIIELNSINNDTEVCISGALWKDDLFNDDRTDSYKFKVATDGKLEVDGISSKNNYYYNLKIGTNPNGAEYYFKNAATHKVSFDVNRGDVVYIKVSKKRWRKYTLSFKFTKKVIPSSGKSFNLTGTLRDFNQNHVDFEPHIEWENNFYDADDFDDGVEDGLVEGYVISTLAEDRTPIINPDSQHVLTPKRFTDWYHDTDGVNMSMPYQIELFELGIDTGVYQFSSDAFFPADGKLFGKENYHGEDGAEYQHNFHMTYEIHSKFTYKRGQVFNFVGDDDVWVFINDKLVVDLGGLHSPESGSVGLDGLQLVEGETYNFDFFWAERHTTGSNFTITTSIELENKPPVDKTKYSCANPKSFSLAYTNNVRGDSKVIGNTILCADQDKDGICDDPKDAKNNSINMINIDIDEDDSTYNSSSAKLELAEDSEVLWAKLYWQGMLYSGSDEEKDKFSEVKFKTPTSDGYISVDTSDNAVEHNWVNYSKDRYYYQASVDITDFVKAGGTGWYTIADIYTKLGKPVGGSYGGWSIVIAYQNDTMDLRNVSVFDGYIGLVGAGDINTSTALATEFGCNTTGLYRSVDIPLSGFLTPKRGTVNSKLSIFAGEGDRGYTGDMLQLADKNGAKHKLTDGLNPEDDVFNSTISEFGVNIGSDYLFPNHSINKNGIDIDTFDTSFIIQNEQESTVVTLNTEGDGYHPSVFSFSTQIYEPELCYLEDIYLNGALYDNTPVRPGTLFDIKTIIKNEGTERAVNVRTSIKFSNILAYHDNSVQIDDIAKTDASDGDEAEVSEGNVSARLGIDANGISGGYLDENSSNILSYQARVIYDDNRTENIYNISFTSDTLGIDFDNVSLRRCKAGVFTPPTAYEPVKGSYNVDEQNKPEGKIYTQIVNKDIKLALKAYDETRTTLTGISSKVGVVVVDTETNSSIKNLGEFTFDENHHTLAISAFRELNASKNVHARVLYCEDSYGNTDVDWKHCYPTQTATCNPEAGYACKTADSWDNFSIRPKRYSLSVPNYLVAGKDFNLTITAEDALGNVVENYEENALVYQLDVNETKQPDYCTLGDIDRIYLHGGFKSGKSVVQVNYNDIGRLRFSVSEKRNTTTEYAKVDKLDGSGLSRFIEDANITTSEIQPDHISLETEFVSNVVEQNIVFYSENVNDKMNANLYTHVVVQNAQNDAVKNFKEGCYAKDVAIKSQLRMEGEDRLIPVLRYINTQNVQATMNSHEISSSISKTLFVNGEGNQTIELNFQRDASNARNPMKLTIEDINASVIGLSDANTTQASKTFIYLRAHVASPQTSIGASKDIKIAYEMYKDEDANSTVVDDAGLGNLPESEDEISWFVLDAPDLLSGLNYANPKALFGATSNPANKTATGPSADVLEIVHKNESTMGVTVPKLPYKNKIVYSPTTNYLLYDRFNAGITSHSFKINFLSNTQRWSGKGRLGMTVDNNTATGNGLQRVDW